MKLRIRKSSLKARRQHGFRAKPGSYIKSKVKKKTLKLKIRARRRRRG